MGREFRRLRSEEVPTPAHLNLAYAELRRLRGLRTAGGIELAGARGLSPPSFTLASGERTDIRLTGPYSGGYPWAEVYLNAAGTWSLTGRTGGPANGDPAFERRKGDTTLNAGPTVFQAVRSPASNQWVFPSRSAGGTPVCNRLSCCPDLTPPSAFHATSGYWGNAFTLTWNPSKARYEGYFMATIGGTGTGVCGVPKPIVFPIWYYLYCDCRLEIWYTAVLCPAPGSPTQCPAPVSATPAATPNRRYSAVSDLYPKSKTCSPFQLNYWQLPNEGCGSSGEVFPGASETVTITL